MKFRHTSIPLGEEISLDEREEVIGADFIQDGQCYHLLIKTTSPGIDIEQRLLSGEGNQRPDGQSTTA